MRTPSINQVFNMYSFHFRFYVYEPCLSEKTFRKTRLSAICFNFIRFFYNEPVFLKYVIHVVLSVKTCPKVHLIHDMCILCTSFLMYKLFLSSLSFFLSFPQPCDSCHQNQNKPFYTSRMLLHHYFYHIDNSWHSRCWTCALS